MKSYIKHVNVQYLYCRAFVIQSVSQYQRGGINHNLPYRADKLNRKIFTLELCSVKRQFS